MSNPKSESEKHRSHEGDEATIGMNDTTNESVRDAQDDTVLQSENTAKKALKSLSKSRIGEFGRYIIQGKLGEGAMGTVYIAQDTQLDRQVALKIPKFDNSDETAIGWFYREARAMATVHHPNLCPVFDVGKIDDTHYLTMGYIEGRPLTDFVKSKKQIQPRQIAAVVRKIAIALYEAHQAGLVHRDLKPANIMINTRKEPVIMDFGLARRERPNEDQLTKTGQIVGTPSYMAPEQVEGKNDEIGPWTDTYALGVIMYQMLCGELPFKGVVTLVLAKIITETPRSPSEIKADVDPELERICLKAKARNYKDRYQSANDLAKALRDYLAGSTSGDTVRRATKSDSTESKEITQTDQLANEYFDVAPAPYEYEYEYEDEEEQAPPVRVKSNRSTGAKRGRKSKARERARKKKQKLFAPIGGGVVVLVLAFMFLRDDPSKTDQQPSTDTTANATTDEPSKDSNVVANDSANQSAFDTIDFGTDADEIGDEVEESGFVYKQAGNRALRLNGKDSYVNLPMFYDGTHPVTVEAIVICKTKDRGAHIISDVESAGIGLLFQDGDWQFVARHGTEYEQARSPAGDTAAKRVHLAGVLDKGTVSLYVNGQRTAVARKSKGAFSKSSSPLVIGANPGRNPAVSDAFKTGDNSYYQYFEGTIDEVRISNVARYHKNFRPPDVYEQFKPDADTLALYHCDDLKDNLLVDASTHGHHAVVKNCELSNPDRMPSDAQLPAAILTSEMTPTLAETEQLAWAKRLGADVTWTNSVGMKMQLIPPSSYQTGLTDQQRQTELAGIQKAKLKSDSLERESKANARISPQAFYLGKTEVTGATWKTVVGEKLAARWSGPQKPVTNLNVVSAMRFCNILSGIEGRGAYYKIDSAAQTIETVPESDGYRLPSDTEWEYAARAGSNAIRYYGTPENYQEHEWINAGGTAQNVGLRKSNPFGLHDMLGNVSEHTMLSVASTKEGKASAKGGNWTSDPLQVRASNVWLTDIQKTMLKTLGFRVALPIRSAVRLGPTSQFCDLISKIDERRDVLSGSWTATDRLEIEASDGVNICSLPVRIKGDYNLLVPFTRQKNEGPIEFVLPIGDKHAHLTLSRIVDDKAYSGISVGGRLFGLDPARSTTSFRIDSKKRYRLHLICRNQLDKLHLTVNVDNEQILETTIPLSDLTTGPRLATLPQGRPALMVAGSSVRFHSIRLRMHNGYAILEPERSPPKFKRH